MIFPPLSIGFRKKICEISSFIPQTSLLLTNAPIFEVFSQRRALIFLKEFLYTFFIYVSLELELHDEENDFHCF